MRSKIYTGEVLHHRNAPAVHTLKYPVYFYLLDLDELEELSENIKFFSHNRKNLISLMDSDYLKGQGSIRDKLSALLRKEGFTKKISRVMLLTSARFFNYAFNPVNFYYCYDSGDQILCMAAEVNNTFGEKHLYILPENEKGPGFPFLASHKKEFHVSPFNDLEGSYSFSFSEPVENISFRIILEREEGRILSAGFTGSSQSLAANNLYMTLFRYPFTAILTIPRIYKEAFKLFFLRKLKYFPKPEPSSEMTIGHLPPTVIQRIARRLFFSFIRRSEKGSLIIEEPGGEENIIGLDNSDPPARIIVKNYAFYLRVILNGEIGLGEAYTEELWDSDDLTAVYNFFIDNMEYLDDSKISLSALGRMFDYAGHLKKNNSLTGSKLNIEAHYDLGNDFFSLFLDSTMSYSCAIFKKDSDILFRAQKNKINTLIEKARIDENHHVLEIGSGWGGFAVEAAERTGCRVTTVTISEKQYVYVKALIKEKGLQDQITVLLKDYRDLEGKFDRVVSVEMLEAVGYENYGKFFQTIERVLKPDGIAVIQVITISDQRFNAYRKRADWIQKYIFPGGLLPSITVMAGSMTKNSGLIIDSLESIGPHYAATLRIWRDRFTSGEKKLTTMGYDSYFQRKWYYYFTICEAAFRKRIWKRIV